MSNLIRPRILSPAEQPSVKRAKAAACRGANGVRAVWEERSGKALNSDRWKWIGANLYWPTRDLPDPKTKKGMGDMEMYFVRYDPG